MARVHLDVRYWRKAAFDELARATQDPPLFVLDANACNSLQRIGQLNELERMRETRLIDLLYTETTWDEAQLGSLKRHSKVSKYLFVGLANDECNCQLQQPWREAIARVVFPGGLRSDNQRRDVEALLTVKMSKGCFVTSDGASKSQPGGILGHKAELAQLGIQVLNFTEALERAQGAT